MTYAQHHLKLLLTGAVGHDICVASLDRDAKVAKIAAIQG